MSQSYLSCVVAEPTEEVDPKEKLAASVLTDLLARLADSRNSGSGRAPPPAFTSRAPLNTGAGGLP